MSTYPNRPTRIPRQDGTSQQIRYGSPDQSGRWLFWTFVSIGIAAAAGLIMWRLQVRDQLRATEKEVSALLVSADQLIDENRDDEAEAGMRRALMMSKDDPRCLAVIERIEHKRKMIHEQKSNASTSAMAQAEALALGDIPAAVAALERIGGDRAYTKEAQQKAISRAKELKGGVCSLRIPKDWPADAVIKVDDVTKNPAGGVVGDIVPGKRSIAITRFGYREPPVVELDFRGLEVLQLPAFEWRLRGTKVFLVSQPAGAAVWQDGKNTGKVTPCTIDDVDDGAVEFIFKLQNYRDTPAKGEVKDRKPVRLSVKLEPAA